MFALIYPAKRVIPASIYKLCSSGGMLGSSRNAFSISRIALPSSENVHLNQFIRLCILVWSTVCVKTQDDAGIYNSC